VPLNATDYQGGSAGKQSLDVTDVVRGHQHAQ